MTIKLDLRTDLHLVREAFDAGQLQGQTASRGDLCLYSGPCAIGVMLPEPLPDDRDNSAIEDLLTTGLIEAPTEQWEDLIRLQEAHDNMMSVVGLPLASEFDHLLTELEAKYEH